MNIHITNLNVNAIESDIQRLFAPYGEIKSLMLVRDKINNRSRGRAFIDMAVEKDGQKAVAMLNGSSLMGKIISVAPVGFNEYPEF